MIKIYIRVIDLILIIIRIIILKSFLVAFSNCNASRVKFAVWTMVVTSTLPYHFSFKNFQISLIIILNLNFGSGAKFPRSTFNFELNRVGQSYGSAHAHANFTELREYTRN